jgi:hypothetical protein
LGQFHDGRLSINALDLHYKSITFVKGGRYGPPAVPKIINIAERCADTVRLPSLAGHRRFPPAG